MRGAHAGRHAPRRQGKALIVLVTAGLIAAACGGGGGKKASTSATTASTEATTTTTAAGTSETTETTAATATTATTAKSTATTAKAASSSTKKATTTTAPGKAVTQLRTGVGNVTSSPTTAPPSDIQPGGTVTYAKTADVANLDPIKITNSGASDGFLADSVYDMLVYSDVATGKIVPQTAESVTSTDAVVWTLKLRPGIKFSDGTAYDAAAVKFNYLRLQDPNNAAIRAAQANLISTMDVVDATTLKITLKSKNAVFPVAMTAIPFVASPAAVTAQGSKYGSDANLVGAGPFLVKTWNRDSQWVLVRNPNYWRSPQPYIDQVVVNPIIDETARKNTFTSGGANMTFLGLGTNADEVNRSGQFVERTMILNGGIVLHFNTKKAPFSDIRARQAVALAIDPKDYAKVVNSGLQEPIDSIFRHDSPFFDASIVQQANDPVKAQQLIDQVAAANGGTFSFTITAFPVSNYQLSAQYVQGKLNAFNHVKVDIVTEASAQHITNCQTGNFSGACGTGVIFDDPEPAWTGLYTCNATPSPTGWCNTQFDKDVADNQATLDPQQRINDIKDAQKIFYSEVPTLHLERRYSWMFHAKNIQNFKYADDGMVLLGELWIQSHG